MSEQLLIEELDRIARRAVDRCFEERGFVLYSGGIDSSILAALVSRKVKPGLWNLFTLGVSNSQDIRNAVSSGLNGAIRFSSLPQMVKELDEQKIIRAAEETKNIVSVQSISHFEDCTAFYAICEEIRRLTTDTRNLLLSANGPDELFCGYDRFRRIVDTSGYEATKREIIQALESANILREQVKKIAARFDIKIVEPFFDSEFVGFCSKQIPIELKISKGNDLLRKRIWRNYGLYLGIPKEIVEKPKKAMQYSMGIHKVILSLIKKEQLVLNIDDLRERKEWRSSSKRANRTKLRF
ncbi:MAG: asparagine synthase-related protein [archaeon]|nr:asparagine synthase-related protein [archaeon]